MHMLCGSRMSKQWVGMCSHFWKFSIVVAVGIKFSMRIFPLFCRDWIDAIQGLQREDTQRVRLGQGLGIHVLW